MTVTRSATRATTVSAITVVAITAVLAALGAGAVGAQTNPTSTTTPPTTVASTTTMASTTTSPPPASTTSTVGPTTTTAPATTTTSAPSTTVQITPGTEPAPAPIDAINEDGAGEPPPVASVPPRLTPRVPTAIDQSITAQLKQRLAVAKTDADKAVAASQAADKKLADVEARQAQLQHTFETLHADDALAAQRLADQRRAMRTRAVAVYVSGPARPVMPAGDDVYEFGRRRVLVQALQAADKRGVEQYRAAKAAAGADVDRLVDQLDDVNGQVISAKTAAEAAAQVAQGALQGFGSAKTGGLVTVNGFVFPVAMPHNFVDTFGAPRMVGTPYFHLHQGNDIFTPYGNGLYAAERGIVTKMGTDRLGGTKLWIVGESGTRYYYAHLSAFADGIVDGTLVEAGTVVGYAGNTGNAATTPTHLHFEIHPSGGPAIDPYPILKAADDATRQYQAQTPQPTTSVAGRPTTTGP